MQNLWEPSFFLTRTTGFDHGDLKGCITDLSCILFSCLANSFLAEYGILRGYCLMDLASPVICFRQKLISVHVLLLTKQINHGDHKEVGALGLFAWVVNQFG